MYSRGSLLATAAMLFPLASGAEAAELWRGTAVITARTATAACIAAYDIGEFFNLVYRPNLGQPVSERMVAIGEGGSILITSTDAANRTLRTGSVSVLSTVDASLYSVSNANNPFTITPAAITTASPMITIQGTLQNAGLPGCAVSFRSYMVPIG